MMKTLRICSALTMVVAICAPASAGMVCSAALEDGITANAGCETGSTNNDFLNPLQVNIDTMFGFDDWVFAEKVEIDPPDVEEDFDIGLSLTGDAISGTWSIDDIWNSREHVMLVLKDGEADPDTYIGYLLVTGDTSGMYDSPFLNLNTGGQKEISHVSAYVRGVPEPSAALLLSLGLAGVCMSSRHRKRG